jgi:hypothetical protein
MLEIGHWKNTDFHPFSTWKSCKKRSVFADDFVYAVMKPHLCIISLEMPVPSQGHYGFHSFPVVD